MSHQKFFLLAEQFMPGVGKGFLLWWHCKFHPNFEVIVALKAELREGNVALRRLQTFE